MVHEALGSPGQPLDPTTRAFFEPRFNHDFSNVRLHSDAKASESARKINALAFTVGQDVVLGAGQNIPGSHTWEALLAHELTHVVQQHGDGQMLEPPAMSQSGDALEQEANAAAKRIMAGKHADASLATTNVAIQRQAPGEETEKKPAEKQEVGEVVTEGLKTAAEQAMDNNPKVKKVIIDPIKDKLKGQWDRFSNADKTAAIGLGAATLGIGVGAMLSDPGGRKKLEGINLATPLTLIPYMPLSNLKYTLPSSDSPDKRLLKLETSFKADDLINIRTEARGLPKMSLGVNMQWGYDPATDRLSILGGDATLGIAPGLSISAGAYKDILRPPSTFVGPEGQITQIRKSVPEFGKPQPIPDVRIMLTVDLMKFKPSDLVRQIKGFF
jgi:hypothetical protein